MTIAPPHIAKICDEYGVSIIPANRYPGVGETRAVGAMTKIAARHGEGHLRLVLTTLAETSNNHAFIDRDTLWCVSHLIRAYPNLIENQMSDWLAVFDEMPLGEMAFHNARSLRGHVKLPHSLAGMVNERIYRKLGEKALEPDLFDDMRETG
ncbi:hypothetical protein [Nitratireductor basaltis]|uniref:Uncharacterized protein n=1 Tax=Nitratireductor basaltis TaxID=472175 RepID=A0A084UBL5_9HYPH|nr:hypothetical protein [Nitratireductor basaltis]KFB10351.1 hypothetical protein EL18_01382 [Nitratireductor basaltis]